jgi:hypothetical protein
MAARIPLIFNTTTNKIEEVGLADSLQLDMQVDLEAVTETVTGSTSTTTIAVTGGTATIDVSLGTIFTGSLASSVTTWAFTNVPTTNGKLSTITLILQGNASFTYGDACSVNGTAITNGVKWSGATVPTATVNIDILSFIIMKDNSGTTYIIGTSTTNIS